MVMKKLGLPAAEESDRLEGNRRAVEPKPVSEAASYIKNLNLKS